MRNQYSDADELVCVAAPSPASHSSDYILEIFHLRAVVKDSSSECFPFTPVRTLRRLCCLGYHSTYYYIPASNPYNRQNNLRWLNDFPSFVCTLKTTTPLFFWYHGYVQLWSRVNGTPSIDRASVLPVVLPPMFFYRRLKVHWFVACCLFLLF